MNWKEFWNHSSQVRQLDFSRQVGRTFHQVPFTPSELDAAAARVLALLELKSNDVVLDVACGNGLITSRVAVHVRRIVAVDFSEPLIATAKTHFSRHNVAYVVADALRLPIGDRSCDAAMITAAFQFFDRTGGAKLLGDLGRVVRPSGRVVLLDVADADRISSFYRGWSGRLQRAVEALRDRPTIGEWWSRRQLSGVAARAGWSVKIVEQPVEAPNHYFRYDAVLSRVL